MIHRVVEAITMEITMIGVVVRRPLLFAAMQSRIDTSLRTSWRMTALVQWSLNFNLPRGKTGILLFGTNYGFDVKRWKCHVWIDLSWQMSANKGEMNRSYRERERENLASSHAISKVELDRSRIHSRWLSSAELPLLLSSAFCHSLMRIYGSTEGATCCTTRLRYWKCNLC